MKRRNFLKNIAAFAATPALPVKLLAAPLPVSAEQYAKAVHWAGLWGNSTAATYKNMLGVDQSVGEAVFQRLQSDGIVGAMDASGIARAAGPQYDLSEVAARLKQTLAPTTANIGASVEASKSAKLDLEKINKRIETEDDAPQGEAALDETVTDDVVLDEVAIDDEAPLDDMPIDAQETQEPLDAPAEALSPQDDGSPST